MSKCGRWIISQIAVGIMNFCPRQIPLPMDIAHASMIEQQNVCIESLDEPPDSSNKCSGLYVLLTLPPWSANLNHVDRDLELQDFAHL